MKTKSKKTKKSKKPLTSPKLLIVALLVAAVGTFFLIRSFADTGTGPKCVSTTQADGTKAASTTQPTCIPVGTSGGLTYWLDNTYPNKKVHVVRVDLNNPRLVMRASHISERGKTPTEFAKLAGAKVTINGDFFYKDNNYITNGLAIGNGEQWTFTKDKPTTTFIACSIKRDCFIDDYGTARQIDSKYYYNAVGGSEILLTPKFQWQLRPGEPGCGTVEHTCSAQHPRTGVALSADRKVMWLVMVEGRQTNLTGLSLYDFTQVFKNLGATWAINLDGGGSAGMVINGNLVNKRPPDEPTERKVGNALGIVELPASATK
jgi:hypothetical protein